MALIHIQKLKRHGWEEDCPMEMMEEELLSYSTGLLDDEREHTVWEEWRLDGKIVKRGAHVTVKKGAISGAVVQLF